MTKRFEKITTFLKDHEEGASIEAIIIHTKLHRSVVRDLLDRMISEGSVAHNKMRKVYILGLANGRIIPLPEGKIITCAFCGHRDATHMAECDGKMYASCSSCNEPPPPARRPGLKGAEAEQFERQVAGAVDRLEADGEDVTSENLRNALGLTSPAEFKRLALVQRKLFPASVVKPKPKAGNAPPLIVEDILDADVAAPIDGDEVAESFDDFE